MHEQSTFDDEKSFKIWTDIFEYQACMNTPVCTPVCDGFKNEAKCTEFALKEGYQ